MLDRSQIKRVLFSSSNINWLFVQLATPGYHCKAYIEEPGVCMIHKSLKSIQPLNHKQQLLLLEMVSTCRDD